MEDGKGKDSEQKPQSLKLAEDDEPLPSDPVIEAYKKDIDRTLLRENLKLSVEERFDQWMEFLRFAEELRRDMRAARHD